MSSYFSNIHISDTQISHIIHNSSHIYIYINAAVSCKRYPPSLPYIIIVQTCGERWDLPKFVDVLSVNLGFSQSLICVYIYVYNHMYIIICIYIYIYLYIHRFAIASRKHYRTCHTIVSLMPWTCYSPFFGFCSWRALVTWRNPKNPRWGIDAPWMVREKQTAQRKIMINMENHNV